ncbi:hypothetical protein XENOCAPTIV_019942 [Xenoophorus captivus]|uniref:Uncharacterized protein n=1 Tax=Xenoophorus captivus TaxID=1517983 RepID=A0ABV0QAT4_9TELE
MQKQARGRVRKCVHPPPRAEQVVQSSGNASRVDEIQPEYLRSLDVVVDTPFQHCVVAWDSASGLADQGGGPPSCEGGCVSTTGASHSYTKVLERTVRTILEPHL